MGLIIKVHHGLLYSFWLKQKWAVLCLIGVLYINLVYHGFKKLINPLNSSWEPCSLCVYDPCPPSPLSDMPLRHVVVTGSKRESWNWNPVLWPRIYCSVHCVSVLTAVFVFSKERPQLRRTSEVCPCLFLPAAAFGDPLSPPGDSLLSSAAVACHVAAAVNEMNKTPSMQLSLSE